MHRTFTIGLAFIFIGCAQVAEDKVPVPAELTASSSLAAPQNSIAEAKMGCTNEALPQPQPNEASLRPRRTPDADYRKNGAEQEARREAARQAAPEEPMLQPAPPPDPKLLDRQAQYLQGMEELRARHRYQDGPAYEKEREALKERIFAD